MKAMDFAIVYLVWRFLYRLFDFFHHWYVDALRGWASRFLRVLEKLDKIFALKITIRYFFVPLYKDYTIVGRILGVIFRSGRVLVASLIYFFVTLVFLALAIVWAAIPLLVIINVFRI